MSPRWLTGDRRWRQGAPGGRAEGLPPPRPGATVSMAQARERGESTWPSVSSRCGGSVSSAPTTVRSTTRPSPPSSRSSMSWRIGTNASRQSGGRPGRDDVASPRRVWRAGPVAEDDERPRVYPRSLRSAVRRIDHWQNSSQRQRWLATALLDIDAASMQGDWATGTCARLRDALKRELKIDTTTSKPKAAVSNQESRRVSTSEWA